MKKQKNISFFDKANNVDVAVIGTTYKELYHNALDDNIITKQQLQQHIDLEEKLMKIIKDTSPKIYETLKKGDK